MPAAPGQPRRPPHDLQDRPELGVWYITGAASDGQVNAADRLRKSNLAPVPKTPALPHRRPGSAGEDNPEG